ncbi:MAG: cation:proton antiporter [Candidatus Micrarchaeota archaeon]
MKIPMLEDVLLVISITYIVSLTLGFLMEKYLKIPWMFIAIFLGIAFSSLGYFTIAIQSDAFQVLSTLGMLIMLFLIGFNIELGKMRKLGKQIVTGTFAIIFFEGISMTLLLYLGFPEMVDNSLLIAFIVALSFATVGEAILLPILREFNVINTKFGQLTLGIGTLDDIIELFTLTLVGLVLAVGAISPSGKAFPSPGPLIFALAVLLAATFILLKFRSSIAALLGRTFGNHHFQYLIILTLFFTFITFGGFYYEGLMPIAAILSGIAARELFPKKITNEYGHIIDFLGYMFLAPLFFLSIGAEVSIDSILIFPILLFSIWGVAAAAKLIASYFLFKKTLGKKFSLLMGLGLSVRFSTSLVVQFILFSNGLISQSLYSTLIATAILMKPFIIYLYSRGLGSERPP